MYDCVTCDFIGRFSVMGEIFTLHQHELRTFLHGISNRHQFCHTLRSRHIITSHNDIFLLYAWTYTKEIMTSTCYRSGGDFYFKSIHITTNLYSFYPEVCFEGLDFGSSQLVHRNNLDQSARLFCETQLLLFQWVLKWQVTHGWSVRYTGWSPQTHWH